jgi:hypothetical protein
VSQLGRLGGALLLESGGEFFLIGNLKRPCDFPAAGFVAPGPIDAVARPWVRLARDGGSALVRSGAQLVLGDPGDAQTLADSLAARLLIERNGSVSDRLWRLILTADPEADPPDEGTFAAHWLVQMPLHLWQIVREAVLKCS